MGIRSESDARLRQLVIESKLVTTEELERIAQEDHDTGLGQLLVEQGVVTSQELAQIVQKQLKIPYIDLHTYQIQPEVLELIPESMTHKYKAIPLAIHNDALLVAMAEPYDVVAIEALSVQAQMRVEPAVAPALEIKEAIDRSYQAYGEIKQQFKEIPPPSPTISERASIEAVASAPAVRALDLLVDEAVKNRASDIHLEPQGAKLRVRYRIDGILYDVMSLPLSALGPLISRLKIMANMNIADRHPQDGQFSMNIRGREIDVRVATIQTAYGERGSLRILDKSFIALSLTDLGFLPDSLEVYKQVLRYPFGMVLIGGPTGSGKTTTLYASTSHLDSMSRNIVTIEDPVEYRFNDINQIQVNPRAGLTFSTGLRSIMRHDPDVILIGEIRDAETAEIAIHAALTGHLVLTSVHANNTAGALLRLIDMGVEPFLVSMAIICVVTQRLVRRVCPHCRHLSQAPIEGRLAYQKELGEERAEFFYGSGCNACSNTGYSGRTAVFEILTVDEELGRLLVKGTTTGELRAHAQKEGMISMQHDGMLKVKRNITTPCEVLRNVFSIG